MNSKAFFPFFVVFSSILQKYSFHRKAIYRLMQCLVFNFFCMKANRNYSTINNIIVLRLEYGTNQHKILYSNVDFLCFSLFTIIQPSSRFWSSSCYCENVIDERTNQKKLKLILSTFGFDSCQNHHHYHHHRVPATFHHLYRNIENLT